jgi:2-dehydro-3-deoxygalactonokinase
VLPTKQARFASRRDRLRFDGVTAIVEHNPDPYSQEDHPVVSSPARLIALDWGTSNLRASLLDGEGRMIETRAGAGGVMAVPEQRFEAALRALAGDWLDAHRVPLIASGMIGSRQGWREAPYLDCPADQSAAAAMLTRVELSGGAVLHIAPGLRCHSAGDRLGDSTSDSTGDSGGDSAGGSAGDRAPGHFDVMRGEETQLWGAELAAGSVCVLPGTHSKWAWMGAGGRIERFATYMTGELYGLLTQHGILGRLMQFGEKRPAAFEMGVRLGLAEHARATHAIFAARTAGLMGQHEAQALPDFLSGILIGIEIGSATHAQTRAKVQAPGQAQGGAVPAAVTVLGDEALVQRYGAALRIAGITPLPARSNATTRGQWCLAAAAGLLDEGGSS